MTLSSYESLKTFRKTLWRWHESKQWQWYKYYSVLEVVAWLGLVTWPDVILSFINDMCRITSENVYKERQDYALCYSAIVGEPVGRVFTVQHRVGCFLTSLYTVVVIRYGHKLPYNQVVGWLGCVTFTTSSSSRARVNESRPLASTILNQWDGTKFAAASMNVSTRYRGTWGWPI